GRPGRAPLALRVVLDDGSGFDLTEAGTQKRLAVYVVRDPAELFSANHEAQIIALVLVGVSLVVFCVLRERRAKELEQVRYVSEAAQRVVLPPLPRRLGPLRTASLYLAAEAEA
ncbi:hypothetical protein ADL27_49020, partial [Streptomyces sp. NRRL F-6602]